jgi:hypothetical protein
MTAPFEQKLLDFLSKICDNTLPQKTVEALCADIGQSVQEKCLDTYLRDNSEEFRLRMSAMGKDLRRLLLEKKHGKEKVTPSMMMRFTYGHLYEAVFFSLMKHAGVEFIPNVKVELPLANGEVIRGELDLVFEADGLIWDVKTCSPYAFKNKWIDWQTVEEKDEFGYFAQLFGYSEATSMPAGGWIVIDKSSGTWKVVAIPQAEHKRLREKYVKEIEAKADHIINRPDEIPPCTGVVDEYFNRKKTGYKILDYNCSYCPYKDGICHKKVSAEPCRHSKAKDKKIKYYVED